MNRRHCVVLLLVGIGLCASTGRLLAAETASALPLSRFSYAEDFEERDPVSFWTSNGEVEVNFKGLTEEQALTGKRSFKLDITVKSGSYHYWRAPVRMPCAGKARFTGAILVTECKSAGLMGLADRLERRLDKGVE